MDATKLTSTTTLHLDRVERWNVFNRLRELSIPCECACGQPLQVTIETATIACQVWSVVQRCTLSRHASIDYLERCWNQRVE